MQTHLRDTATIEVLLPESFRRRFLKEREQGGVLENGLDQEDWVTRPNVDLRRDGPPFHGLAPARLPVEETCVHEVGDCRADRAPSHSCRRRKVVTTLPPASRREVTEFDRGAQTLAERFP
ncbi:hypothetical protein [Curtobacterium sp. VKM Ac-2887]|uniref:hypothetical protein n=1 Tax=Curtobacterium sp. VKM Ac-2887 TaxID=2783819 RepID=UPI00188D9075|nr:hypothetical protein [Curtobacterium sp. VKM Ac-2887]MBF4588282.1 hypothetical protein [Curtobacterium sp. VKM Ac-2887]